MTTKDPSVRVLADGLEKPEIDSRSYRIIELKNKLEAILIHDATTDNASVALNVGVGSYADTKEMPGIAHAIEHMSTMGSEKFPAESHYEEYLTKYGGDSNAMTNGTWTCYYAQMNATKDGSNASSDSTDREPSTHASPLHGVLDIFSQFYTHPLLTETVVEREMKAVDSEHSKNRQMDPWRTMQLDRTLSNKDHPRNCFATGDYKTLYENPIARGVNPREAFIAWYQKHYSADRMKLAVIGRESLDQLQEWVSHFFSDVPNKSLGRLDWGDIPVYGENEVRTQVFVKSVMDIRTLSLKFSIPSQWDQCEYITDHYIAHIIGYEGEGSLLAYLKSLGWATALSAGCIGSDQGEPTGNIDIGLTPQGWDNYREVAKLAFQYLGMIRRSGPQKRISDELTKLGEINFRFKQNSTADATTVGLCTLLQQPFDRRSFLKATSVPAKYDPAKIEELVEALIPQKVRLVMTAQNQDVVLDQVQENYGTEYRCEPIPADFMDELREAYDLALKKDTLKELHLPKQNDLIPENLEVRKSSSAPTAEFAPQLIRNELGVRTWYKKDDTFLAPKAFISVRIRSSVFPASPFIQTVAELHMMLLEYMLSNFSYDASMAGLDFETMVSREGHIIVVDGYNDKLTVLLERLMGALKELEFSSSDFAVVKNMYEEQVQNTKFASVLHQGRTRRNWIMTEGSLLPEDELAILRQVTENDVRELPKYMFRQAHIEVIAYGNVSQQDALRATEIVESVLKPIALPSDFWPPRRQLELPAGVDHVYQCTSMDPNNKNQFIHYNLWLNDHSDVQERAKARLLDAMIGDPLFDDLRTKKQLGYIIKSDVQTDRNPWCFVAVVQSLRDPDYLEEQIEIFLTGYENTLEGMSDEDFDSHRTGLIGKLLRKTENMRQEIGRLSAPLAWRSLDFESNQIDAKALRTLTKDDILSLYRTKIKPGSSQRTKLVVQLRAQDSSRDSDASAPASAMSGEKDPQTESASPTIETKLPEKATQMPRVLIDDVLAFRSSMKLAPEIRPVKALKEFESRDVQPHELNDATDAMARL